MDASSGPDPLVDLVRLASVDSTNRYAADAARAGARGGLVVVADEQTAGRGRRGRHWEAPPGSALLCSMLFRPRLGLTDLHVLPSLVALAALDAITNVAGLEATIKWPNDLLVDELKVAGLLGEIVAAPGTFGELLWPAVVVGIGINVAWPDGWPPPNQDGPLAGLAERATTLSRASGRAVSREPLLDSLLEGVRSRCRSLCPSGAGAGDAAGDTVPVAGTAGLVEETMVEYRRRCSTIGRMVRIELSGTAPASGSIIGRAVGLADDGRLLVDRVPGGPVVAIDAGDVVHLRRWPEA